MSHKLSGGVIADILDGKKPNKPRVQVLGQKQISSSNGNSNDRYRLLISDGIYTHSSALIALQLNPMIGTGELDNYTIIQLNEYNINDLPNGKKVLIIVEVDVITNGEKVGDRIGTPAPYKAGDKRPVDCEANTKPATPAKKEMAFYGQNKENKFNVKTKSVVNSHGDAAPMKIYPIMSLTPYQNKWTIRARVTNKSDIRTWSNSKGTGKLFSVTLTDESGQIKATMFKNEVDKFYDLMENDKVFYISRAQLKTANKQFNHLKNEYELTFSGDTTVDLCVEEVEIPELEYEFVKIQNIQECTPNSNIDVIGIMKHVGDLQTIVTKATQKQVSKLEVTIVDQGLLQINVTLWGIQAENFSQSGNPVIAVRGARVSDWNGRSLSVSGSSELSINPNIKETKALTTWYQNEGESATMSEYARDGNSTASGGEKYLTMAQVNKVTSELSGDKAEYFWNDSMVIFVKKDNCLYKACPSVSCNKKLVELGNDLYRCEKCSLEVDSFDWRMLLNAHFSDSTGDIWGTCFQDCSQAILGMEIKEVAELRETDDEAYNKVFEDALFKPFSFKFRSKMDTYNDEARLKTVCLSANKINYADKNISLLENIDKLLQA